jgi:hypothetical protein
MKLALMSVALLAFAETAAGQPTPQVSQRIVGDRVSGNMQIEAKSRTMIDTATLTFQNPDGGLVYTIDFIAHHPVQGPVASAGVVDIVVTQHPVEDDSPEMMLRVDGETVPTVTRLQSKRSVVATISLDEFDRIARAGVVVDRTFDTELELGPGQVWMLRLTADRWLGRVR